MSLPADIKVNDRIRAEDGTTGTVHTIEAKDVTISGKSYGKYNFYHVGERRGIHGNLLPAKWYGAEQIEGVLK